MLKFLQGCPQDGNYRSGRTLQTMKRPSSHLEVEDRLNSIESEVRRIRALYERTLSYRLQDPETSLIHARKAAEAVCRQLFTKNFGCQPGSIMLEGLIEKLVSKGALPNSIVVPLRTIQGYGNFASHEHEDHTGGAAMTPDYIQPCLQALATVVSWYFSNNTVDSTRIPSVPNNDGGHSAVKGQPVHSKAEQPNAGGNSVPIDTLTPATRQSPVRIGDLALELGITSSAAIRLAREALRLELRTPSATLTPEQALQLEDAIRISRKEDAGSPYEKFRLLDLGDGIQIEFALIPSGSFIMGSPDDEEGHNDDEVVHEVQIKRPFYLGVYPVTQSQYKKVTGANPSYFTGANLPVEMVSWFDASGFCEVLSDRFGRRLRLPTEAEWEFACRGGTTTPFSFGNEMSTNLANYDGKFSYGGGSSGETRWHTTEAAAFPKNPWDVCDMHGNVWEWCSDWYGEYPAGGAIDPTGPKAGDIRILRGGSWFNSPADARSAQRDALDPGRRHSIYGFRLLMEP